MKARLWFAAAFLCFAAAASATVPSPAAKREIGQLFDAMAASGCTFSRNGSWHDAAQARAHLQRKYDHLLKKELVTTAESFIALAATKSSMTGTVYRVRCGTAPPVDSAEWFRARLDALRNPTSTPAPAGRPRES